MFMDSKYWFRITRRIGWEPFTSKSSDKVFQENLVKHFSSPSILQELSQLLEATVHASQESKAKKYFCSLGIAVDIGLNQNQLCRVTRFKQRKCISIETWLRKQASCKWVAVFFQRCYWIFQNHFHLSGWVIHGKNWSSMCGCQWLQIQFQSPT